MTPKKICIKDSVIDTLLISNPHFNDGELHYKGEVSYILESEHDRVVEELKTKIMILENKLSLT